MNCQKGDMARMIKATFPENVGLIVTVIEETTPVGDSGHLWMCKPAWPSITTDWFDSSKRYVSAGLTALPDAWLRPIRPDAEPVTTDVVAEVGA